MVENKTTTPVSSSDDVIDVVQNLESEKEKSFFSKIADGVADIIDEAVLFYDKHPRFFEGVIGVAASLAAMPLSPIASVAVGGAVAVGANALSYGIHKRADSIRLKRSERGSIKELAEGYTKEQELGISQQRGAALESENLQQEAESSEQNPEEHALNEGRKPARDSIKYDNHHAEKIGHHGHVAGASFVAEAKQHAGESRAATHTVSAA